MRFASCWYAAIFESRLQIKQSEVQLKLCHVCVTVYKKLLGLAPSVTIGYIGWEFLDFP